MKTIIILFLSVISIISTTSAQANECLAKSPEELQIKFEQAFLSKNKEALLSLFNWIGVDSLMEKQLKTEFANLTLNKNSIHSELRDPLLAQKDADSIKLYLNVIPVKTFYFERSYGLTIDPSNRTTGRLAIGKVGTCYLFGAYSKTKIS